MALDNCYTTLDDVRDRIEGLDDTGEDDLLEEAITSSCRALDEHLGQFFYATDTPTARVFTPLDAWTCYVDPFLTDTGLVVKTDVADDAGYATTWAASDYELDYFGGDWGQSVGAPFDTIRAVAYQTFPVQGRRRRTVQVTARWGWSAPPRNIVEASKILAIDLYSRRNAPFGIATQTIEFGPLRIGRDVLAQVQSLVGRYRRLDRRIGIA